MHKKTMNNSSRKKAKDHLDKCSECIVDLQRLINDDDTSNKDKWLIAEEVWLRIHEVKKIFMKE